MRHFIKTAVLLVLLTLLFAFLGLCLGGKLGFWVALPLGLLISSGVYWGHDKLVLKTMGAVAVSYEEAPEVYDLTSEITQKEKIPFPEIYWIASVSLNSFAVGRNAKHGAIALTQGLVERLNREELKSVMAHELACLVSGEALFSGVVGAIAGTASALAMMLRGSFSAGEGQTNKNHPTNPVLFFLYALLTLVAAVFIRSLIFKACKYTADRESVRLCGNSLYLASALQKISIYSRGKEMFYFNPALAHLFIVSPVGKAGFSKIFMTHPLIEKRIARLEAMARGVDNKSD